MTSIVLLLVILCSAALASHANEDVSPKETFLNDDGEAWLVYTLSGTSIFEQVSNSKHEKPQSSTSNPTLTSRVTNSSTSNPVTTAPRMINNNTIPSIDTWTTLAPLGSEVIDLARRRVEYMNGTLPWPLPEYLSLLSCDDLHGQWAAISHGPSDLVTLFDRGTATSSIWFTMRHTTAVCDGPFTTFCDGVTRAMCSPLTPKPVEIRSMTDAWKTVPTATITRPPFLLPSPQCSIPSVDCTRLWEDYINWLTNRKERGWAYTTDDRNIPQPYRPDCASKATRCDWCGFANNFGKVEFLHWNVDTDESHLCPNQTTTSPTVLSSVPGPIMTARWREFTLTSPTAYVWFATMAEDNGCGSIHTNVMVPVIPEKVSTMVPAEKKVDYRHFAYTTIGSYRVPLVPLSAYLMDMKVYIPRKGDGKTVDGQTVYHDFSPAIIYEFYPGALRSIDTAWELCSNLRFADQDPPIALSPTVMEDSKLTLDPIRHTIPPVASQHAASAAANGPLPRPGASQVIPYALETGVPQPSAAHEVKAPQLGVSDVVVSKTSTLTMYASTLDAHPAADEAMIPAFLHGSILDVPQDSGQLTIHGSKNGGPFHPASDQQHIGAIFGQSGKEHTAEQVASSPGEFFLDGSTLTAGGSAMTVDGAVISAFESGILIQTGVDVVDRSHFTSSPDKQHQAGHGLSSPTMARKRKKNKANTNTCISWDAVWLKIVVTTVIIYNYAMALG